MDKDKIKGFPTKHPILFHLILIVITAFILLYAVLCVIDSFTGHGVYETVPNVKGMTLQEASHNLVSKGLKWQVVDSVYNDDYQPGAVVEQEPKEDSKVKPQRTIYLMLNAVSPRTVSVPSLVDMSYRQGMAMLEGLGFKNIAEETVDSPYKDLILDVKVNGKELIPGAKYPVTSKIVVVVGNGYEDVMPDSIEAEFGDIEAVDL